MFVIVVYSWHQPLLKLDVSRDRFSYFRSGGVGWIHIWGAAACFGRGVVATPGKVKEKV
jgi:hypothetical protein